MHAYFLKYSRDRLQRA